jgi:hypothetical protein
VVLGVLLLLTLGLTQTAVRVSGRASDYPDTELLPGAWLAFLGACVVGVAVAATAAHRPPVPVRIVEPPPAPAAVAVSPAPAAQRPASAAGWSERPVWEPWWRRRGPRIRVLAGIAALALVAGTGVWLAGRGPSTSDGHSGDLRRLVLPTPPGSTPLAPDGQSVAGMDGLLGAVRAQVSQAAFGGWVEPSGRDRVTIALLRFDSESEAIRTFSLVSIARVQLTGVPGASMPGMPDVESFAADAGVSAIGERGDVIFLIVYAGPDASVAAVEGLAGRQYDLL